MGSRTKQYFTACLALLLIPGLLWGAESEEPQRENYYPADYREVRTSPEVGEPIQKYAEDGQEGPQRNFGVQPVHDNKVFSTFKADRFEHRWQEHDVEVFLWDVQGWIGNDFDKVYLESEGEVLLEDDEPVEEATVELLYSRNVDTFWDLRVGVRHDFEPNPERTWLALGLLGLAPQWIEVDANAYLSEDGDVAALVEVEYEWMLTQRLVVIPRLETELSLQDVPEYEQWEGITGVTLGARLMYHIRRELAPYVGISWSRLVGETGSRVDSAGGDVDNTAWVAGLRFWF